MGQAVFEALSLPALVLIFLGAGAAVWIAGIYLSDTTDILSYRLGIGEALGGAILLAIVTNLPEIAITVTASLSHNLSLATGNILGGIAIQTVVLVAIDGFGVRDKPLSYYAADLVLVLEGALVIGVLGLAVMATQLPVRGTGPVDAGAVLIFLAWVAGLGLLNRAGKGLPWQEQGNAPGAQSRRNLAQVKKYQKAKERGTTTARATGVFLVASAVTLAAGVVLEETGSHIASDMGMSGVLFGSTILAALTSLPELSTGLASVRLGDYKLAFSDIFGGNAFLPVLFLPASILSGSSVLPFAASTDIYLTSLGIVLTMVYLWGLIFRPQRQFLRLGPDSAVVLAMYALGTWGLVAVARG
ncbi:MAG TPA: sodium:calcium antiporter [Chloroflexota bacterium]|nr:sodium:calcium antiporter [Chloroflexota bacterium]